MERPDELEGMLGVPVFAVVPRSQNQLRLQENVMLRRRGLHVLAQTSPEDIAVEGVRNLCTSLQLSLDQAENNVVMITGSRPDSGKSFLSVNLSALVASAKKRVLIIDGDMRRGDVHSHFGITHQPGLSDMLSGRRSAVDDPARRAAGSRRACERHAAFASVRAPHEQSASRRCSRN